MKIKHVIGLFMLSLTLPLFASSEIGGDKHDYDKFKAEKIAYLTEAINLTPQEAEIFWPVYNEYEKKKWELMHKRRELERSIKDGIEEMPEKEYIWLSRELSSITVKDGKLAQEYNEKFLKILPPKKVVELYRAEMDFRNHLLKNFRSDHKKDNNKE